MIRVLHSVETYMQLSENLIYPQIVRVPDVQSRVTCGSLINQKTFPIENSRLIVDLPPWRWAMGIPRLGQKVAKAVGLAGRETEWRMRLWHPQLLHAHMGMQGWKSLGLKTRLDLPMVTSFYGCDAWMLPQSEPVWLERYRELFARGDAFLVEGPAMRQRLQELGCPADKVRIQRIGVNLETLAFERRHFAEGLKVVMVGRFVEKKGMVDGLRACALARSRGANLSITIIGDAVAGDPAGAKIKDELLALAQSPALSGRVHFAGFLSWTQMRAALAGHNVFLCPSKRAANGDAEGGSPVVLTEAAAMGLLCLGTVHCDIPEVILDGKTGYLCPEGDFTALADILCKLGEDPNRLTALCEAGRKHVEENFSLLRQLDKLEKTYKSVLMPR